VVKIIGLPPNYHAEESLKATVDLPPSQSDIRGSTTPIYRQFSRVHPLATEALKKEHPKRNIELGDVDMPRASTPAHQKKQARAIDEKTYHLRARESPKLPTELMSPINAAAAASVRKTVRQRPRARQSTEEPYYGN